MDQHVATYCQDSLDPGAEVLCLVRDPVFALDLHGALAMVGLDARIEPSARNLRRSAVALVIDMDGMRADDPRLAAVLRRYARTRRPVITIADPDRHAASTALQAACSVTMPKPVPTDDLAAILAALIASTAQTPSPTAAP